MEINMNRPLGEGISAYVFWGTFAGEEVAIKRILKRPATTIIEDKTIQNREEDAMKQLNHENVLKLIHVEQDENFKYLVLELCVATVDDYIRENKKDILAQINMPSELNALKQMTNGLLYIHLQRFVHRDIKPANILISQSGILKISDFGFSRLVSVSGNFSAKSSPKGTRIYYAPEYLELEEKSATERESIRANKSIDIFSLGCLFFNYITKGGHPFAKTKSVNEIFILPNIAKGKKFLANGLALNHYAYQMIDGMTQAIPEQRWTLTDVIETLNNQKL